jgi:hypothetical protein
VLPVRRQAAAARLGGHGARVDVGLGMGRPGERQREGQQEALGHEQWVRKVATGMRRDSALLDELLVRAILV